MRNIVGVVEDDAGVRESLSALLASHGLSARLYDSAEAFWRAFWGDLEAVDIGCMVLDLNLPGMSGLDLLKKLKAANTYLPVILMSGRTDQKTVVEALSLGAVDFFAKPFSTRDLVNRIQELLVQVNSRSRRSTANGIPLPSKSGRLGIAPQHLDRSSTSHPVCCAALTYKVANPRMAEHK